jgi:hypothetical protein
MEENRYTYHFDNTLGVAEVRELIDTLTMHDKIDLFITTEGGETVSTEVLIHYLNSRKDDITLYFIDYVMSSGIFLLTDFKGKKVITESLDYILAHKIDRMVYMNREQPIAISVLQEQLEVQNNEIAKKLSKIGFNKQEVKDYNLGKDVILLRKDFNRLKI